jgi:hypothetical protein
VATGQVDDVWDEWKDAVNITAKELATWLETPESKAVGDKAAGGESTGHESGRRIVEILRANKGDLMNWGTRPSEDLTGDARRSRPGIVPPPRLVVATDPHRGGAARAHLAHLVGVAPAGRLYVRPVHVWEADQT